MFHWRLPSLSCFISLQVLLLCYWLSLSFKAWNVKKRLSSAFAMLCVTCIHLWTFKWLYINFLVLLNGHVEINLGPRCITDGTFSVCHWNLNSLSGCNYNKLFLQRAYIAVHKFDVISLSETYLDSAVASV